MGTFHKKLFHLGAKKRNPSIFNHFADLKKTEKLPLSDLQILNENRLRDLCAFAFEHSPFYRDRFLQIGFNPLKDWSLNKFKQVPLTTKQDLILNNGDIHTPSNLFEKRFFVETSGTSGEILSFYRDESWDSFNRAAIWRGYTWFGAQPWDRKLYFWGYNTAPLKRLKLTLMDFLVNRFRLFDYDPKKLKKLLPKLRTVQIIEGYSSMIYELANLVKDQKPTFDQLKLVKGTSEKIFPHYQPIAASVYGMKIASEYGSTESGIIAFECPHGQMHVNMEGVFVEQDPEDQGIIVTNLQSFSFPSIRYKLGDQIELETPVTPCQCGMHTPIIKEVTGRIGKKIFGQNQIYPSLTLYYIFKNLYFNQHKTIDFQAHQFQKGHLQIWVKEPVSEELQFIIRNEATKYFSDIELEIIENHNFREQAGKLRDFVSHLD